MLRAIGIKALKTGVEQHIHLAVKHVEHLAVGAVKVEQLNTC